MVVSGLRLVYSHYLRKYSAQTRMHIKGHMSKVYPQLLAQSHQIELFLKTVIAAMKKYKNGDLALECDFLLVF